MSKLTPAEHIRGFRLSDCSCAPICERADDDRCDQCVYMDGLADEVEAVAKTTHELIKAQHEALILVESKDDQVYRLRALALYDAYKKGQSSHD